MAIERGEVEEFLTGVRLAIDNRILLFKEDRDKNKALMLELGLSVRNVIEIIYNLKTEEFCHKTPYSNRYDILVFGTIIDDVECYIKLQLAKIGEVYYCTCDSFHRPEKQLEYPFRGGE